MEEEVDEEEDELEEENSVKTHFIEFSEDGGITYSFPLAKEDIFSNKNNLNENKIG